MSTKLKAPLQTRLARQKKSVEDTQEQLDWIEQQEAKASKVGQRPTT